MEVVKTEDLQFRLEKEFPYSALVLLAEGAVEEGQLLTDEISQNLHEIISHPGFSSLSQLTTGADIEIKQTSTGKKVKILKGSFVLPEDLYKLEDPFLTRVLKEATGEGFLRPQIPRDHFQKVLMHAAVLIGLVSLADSLNLVQKRTLVKTALAEIMYDPQDPEGEYQEAAVLLHAAAKLIIRGLKDRI